MGLFKRQPRAVEPSSAALRPGNCIYVGQPFPRKGEHIDVASLDVQLILNREEIPQRWTECAEIVRQRTAEPAERRVLANILGIMLGMVELKMNALGPGLDLESAAQDARNMLRSGVDSIPQCRSLLAEHPRGPEYFDFEVVKIVSMLAILQSSQARADAGWPVPDTWGGDVTLFSLPH